MCCTFTESLSGITGFSMGSNLYVEGLTPYPLASCSQVALVVKNPHASAGDIRDLSLIPESGRSPAEGNGNPLQLENPLERGTWLATDHRVTKSWT